MSTMCSCCAPSHLLDWNGDLVDHGFSMPDTRETYEVHGPCTQCDGTGEISIDMGREDLKNLTVKGLPITAGDFVAARGLTIQEYLEENYPQECGDCYGGKEHVIGSVSVSIERKWGQCDCESGESVMVGHTWAIKGPGCSMSVPSDVDTYLVVRAVWPTAREPERDYDWESERGLRIAEGWGC